MDLDILFRSIGEQAVKAALPKIDKNDNEPDGWYSVFNPDGTFSVREAKPDWRDHKAHAIADFCAYVSAQGEYLTSLGEALPVVWYSRLAAVAVLNDAESRRDRITLPLELSPQVKTLLELEASVARGVWHEQRAFVSLLRIKLARCLESDALLKTIRNVKFSVNQTGGGNVQTTKRSTGSAIESSITGEGDLPDDVLLRVPLFVGLPVVASVRCAIDTNPAQQSFQLIPLAGEIEDAIRAGETWLGEQLAEGIGTSGSCYFGQP